MFVRITSVAVLLTGLLACETETPCTRYADYVCSCHADDTGFDCAEIEALAENPSQAVADQCATDLADLQAEDDANGETCAI